MERASPDPVVSVVVPLFNCLRLTQAMLGSLDATWPAGVTRELILVDDGSTDGTRDWLASLRRPDVRVVLNPDNLGYAASNNRGAGVARGRTLALLNNDLVLQPGWLEPLLAVQAELGSAAGVIGNVQYAVRDGALDHAGIRINAKGKPEHIRDLPSGSDLPWSFRRWLRVDAVTGACLVIDRGLWFQLGGLDEAYVNGCEDVDLCLRAAAAGRINVVALRSRVLHHVSSSLGRKDRDESNTFRLTRRWRDQLAGLGMRRWCHDYLIREWSHAGCPAETAAAAAAVLLYLLHVRSNPPPVAVEGMRASIDREIARWEALAA